MLFAMFVCKMYTGVLCGKYKGSCGNSFSH